jgi:hypothetical protein
LIYPKNGDMNCPQNFLNQLPIYLTFMGPCIVRIFQYISNKM